MALLALFIFCLNNWLLGAFVNQRLFLAGAAISEYSVPGQPYAGWYRFFDILSGLLLLAAASWLIYYRNKLPKIGKYFIAVCLVFALGNSVDGLLPLDCSETLSKSCSLNISLEPSHFLLPSHAYSSVLIAVSYFSLPLVGYLVAKENKKASFFLRMSLVATIAALVFLLVAIISYYTHRSFDVPVSGWLQIVHLFIFSLWFLAAYRHFEVSFKEH